MLNISQNIQNAIILSDTYLDYCPVLSFFNNTADLVTKTALGILSRYLPFLYESIKNEPLVKHLEAKHSFLCVLLLVPIFNIFVASVLNESPATGTEESRSPTDPDVEAPFQQAKESQAEIAEKLSESITELERHSKNFLSDIEKKKVQLYQDYENDIAKIKKEFLQIKKNHLEKLASLQEGDTKINLLGIGTIGIDTIQEGELKSRKKRLDDDLNALEIEKIWFMGNPASI